MLNLYFRVTCRCTTFWSPVATNTVTVVHAVAILTVTCAPSHFICILQYKITDTATFVATVIELLGLSTAQAHCKVIQVAIIKLSLSAGGAAHCHMQW